MNISGFLDNLLIFSFILFKSHGSLLLELIEICRKDLMSVKIFNALLPQSGLEQPSSHRSLPLRSCERLFGLCVGCDRLSAISGETFKV